MIFFDKKSPDKYENLKRELIPYTLNSSCGKNLIKKNEPNFEGREDYVLDWWTNY
jgi:hypothetical protein